jgi:hypothetical protein
MAPAWASVSCPPWDAARAFKASIDGKCTSAGQELEPVLLKRGRRSHQPAGVRQPIAPAVGEQVDLFRLVAACETRSLVVTYPNRTAGRAPASRRILPQGQRQGRRVEICSGFDGSRRGVGSAASLLFPEFGGIVWDCDEAISY